MTSSEDIALTKMATDAVLSPMGWTKVSCKTKPTLWQLVFNSSERQYHFLKDATADLYTFGFWGFGPLGFFFGKPLPKCSLLGFCYRFGFLPRRFFLGSHCRFAHFWLFGIWPTGHFLGEAIADLHTFGFLLSV